MPFRHSILNFITVFAHLVYITKRVYAIILLSLCIIISINVITIIIRVFIGVIVAIIVIIDIIYVQPSILKHVARKDVHYLCTAFLATCFNIETSYVVQISIYDPPQEMYIKYEVTVTCILSAGSHVSIFFNGYNSHITAYLCFVIKMLHDPGSRNCAIIVLYTITIVPSSTSRV